MLSQFVTAARGLFARQDSAAEESEETPNQTSSPNMVSATRRTVFPANATAEDARASSPATNGKRKITTASKRETETQAPKRRKKRTSNEGVTSPAAEVTREGKRARKLPIRSAESSDSVVPEEQVGDASQEPEQVTESNTKSTHVRFGSEEPDPEVNGHEEPIEEEPKLNGAHDSEDSDDEAPETVDNSAQLRKLKEVARKEAQAKQRAETLEKEKRRERDQRLKAQAIAKPVPIKHTSPGPQDRRAKQDEILSESSATLQGSTAKPSRSLPTLLPDEILNAEPSAYIPTFSEIESNSTRKMPKKHKFLDKVEKRPKDIKVRGTSIRVLESSGSGSGCASLPPKTSKGTRRVKESWMAGNRTLPSGGSLRRITAGSGGFVRK
ncbi:hypothetical protein AJ79_05768 [Helicocarpus griseus UAMH5409]|uniref:Immediate-early protein n=1 Tax=Helicocarpus griseus UAMH5409 TaxID=1447875 RepID=A0A2B7XJE5_9EURO|nr:hypothetical protein AJ79_05768 [Helicocarpus griseus UAMH5409]